MANRYPLVFDATAGNKIKELPTGDNLNLLGNSIVDAVNISASGSLNASTLNVNNININNSPIGEVAKTNSYNDLDNLPILFSGDYNDLINKPVLSVSWPNITEKPFIATRLSELINDTNFASSNSIIVSASQIVGLADIGRSGSFNDLQDVPNFVTQEQIAGGTLTIDVNNTGNLEGSVLGIDGTTLLVDADNNVLLGKHYTVDGTAGLTIATNQITGSDIKIGHDFTGKTYKADKVDIGADEVILSSMPKRVNASADLGTPTPIAEVVDWPANQLKLAELSGLTYTIYNSPVGAYGLDYSTVFDNKVLSVTNDGTISMDGYQLNEYGGIYSGYNLWRIENGQFYGDVVGSLFADDSSLLVDAQNAKFNGLLVGLVDGDIVKTGNLAISATGNIESNVTGSWSVVNASSISRNPLCTWSVTASDSLTLENTTGNLRVEALGGNLDLTATGPVTITSDTGGGSSSSIVVNSSGITFNGTVSGLVVNTGNEAYHNFAPTTTTVNFGNTPVASGNYLQTDEVTPVDIEATITASTGYTKSRIELNASVQNFTDSTTEMQIDLVRLVNGANETVLKSLIFPVANTFYGSQSFLHIDTHGASVGDTVTYKLKVNMSGYSNESARLVTGICGDTLFVKEIA